VVIVHGGGKGIGRLQKRLGLEPRFIEGLRVTDAPSLEAAQMVLSGQVNKRLVARLVSAGVPAVGLSGVDGGLLRVEKLHHPAGDLGLVGHIVKVNTELLGQGLVPVISPISLGLDGQTYNVNADHAALAVAQAMNAASVIFLTNVPGVLREGQVISHIGLSQAEALITEGIIAGGMIPKARSALEAVAAGVGQAVITDLAGLQAGTGTVIC
jgi:acetylglutamate kinase